MAFQPGQSGNPLGRPPVNKEFQRELKLALSEAGKDGDKLRDVALSLIEKALSGDVQAIREIADRIDGKVTQPVGGDKDAPAIKLEIGWKSNESKLTTSQESNSLDTTIEQNAGPALSLIAGREKR
jgi:hypothetical protein